MAEQRFDREKFKRLVQYIAFKAGKRDWFGATKLNKVLWFADARLYNETGRSITGETYIRQKFGPVPRDMMPARAELVSAGLLRVVQEGQLTRLVSEREPDMSDFSRDELRTIDYWIEHIDKDHTAETISEETHDVAWEIAGMGEEMPLNAFRVSRLRIPEGEDLERLKRQAEELES